jgi:hypothetical protein
VGGLIVCCSFLLGVGGQIWDDDAAEEVLALTTGGWVGALLTVQTEVTFVCR